LDIQGKIYGVKAMKANLVKKQLTDGEPSRGAWLGLPSPFSARLLARLPLDWLVIDAEHAPIDSDLLTQMVTAIAEADGPAPLVRISQASVENIKRALDAGAYGVIAPMINTPEEAAQVVAWAKFPPQGERSFGSAYAGLAFGQSMGEYLKAANEQVIVGIQIESAKAFENLDAIFDVKGIDLVFVGPVDLSISLGLAPLPENPDAQFQRFLNRVIASAKPHRLPLGIFCSNGRAAAERIRQGFQFVNVASDTGILPRSIAAELEASR
jgi:4-hydroxy-2-oxoheptanedioate aldolase